ncbi:prepilin-type N-terminal cleavage/methylation domain-containing protein [Desulfocurvus vexinensis]|uniref:prepilin-type N-terminal cleavage/methylation domain-containing protein n=1 Tax=Desulfocurvus vexinensis TaxID=399548 RepID=UPI00048E148F|nr:prepilin-type N-terminal cleavage/methylation domain-containing protein [Desulfocurvus vexinensis]
MRFEKQARGFTLIEMAIVLVIIGIILAGVMKGRDIVRGSQVKQFSQQFAQKWQTVAQTYYDKTGRQLNDGILNGAGAGDPNGFMDGEAGVNADTIEDVLDSVGITVCGMIKSKITTDFTHTSQSTLAGCEEAAGTPTKNLFVTLVEGEYAGTLTVMADLVSLTLTMGSGNIQRRNCVVLYNVPTDVAIGLDTAIDGLADGTNGSFVNLRQRTAAQTTGNGGADYAVNAAVTPIQWGDATLARGEDVAIVLDF